MAKQAACRMFQVKLLIGAAVCTCTSIISVAKRQEGALFANHQVTGPSTDNPTARFFLQTEESTMNGDTIRHVADRLGHLQSAQRIDPRKPAKKQGHVHCKTKVALLRRKGNEQQEIVNLYRLLLTNLLGGWIGGTWRRLDRSVIDSNRQKGRQRSRTYRGTQSCEWIHQRRNVG